MIDVLARPEGRRITLAADRAYETRDFVSDLRGRCVTRTSHRTPVASAPRWMAGPPGTRLCRHQRVRKPVLSEAEGRIEEVFGWVKMGRRTGQDALSRTGTRPLRLHADGRRLQPDPAAPAAGDGAMSELVGRWRIVEAVAWPREHLDLCGLAFLHIDADGSGEMAFGAHTAVLTVGFTPNGVDLDWNCSDGGGHAQGAGRADLCDDARPEGEIA